MKGLKTDIVFSIPKHQTKDESAVFLCTDTTFSAEEILEIYALRWGIELYFKEIKQYFHAGGHAPYREAS